MLKTGHLSIPYRSKWTGRPWISNLLAEANSMNLARQSLTRGPFGSLSTECRLLINTWISVHSWENAFNQVWPWCHNGQGPTFQQKHWMDTILPVFFFTSFWRIRAFRIDQIAQSTSWTGSNWALGHSCFVFCHHQLQVISVRKINTATWMMKLD